MNKTAVRHCLEEDCDPASYLDEDQCLNSCLVDKFVAETGCVHPRLKLLLRRHGEHLDPRGAIRVCDYHDLSNLVRRRDSTINCLYFIFKVPIYIFFFLSCGKCTMPI